MSDLWALNLFASPKDYLLLFTFCISFVYFLFIFYFCWVRRVVFLKPRRQVS